MSMCEGKNILIPVLGILSAFETSLSAAEVTDKDTRLQ